jgi:hypothetical protein
MSGLQFWDRQRNLLPDVLAWAQLYESTAYRNVAVDKEGESMVSTIWEGFEALAQMQDYTPAIFETATFDNGKLIDKYRWVTEEDALEGHAQLCRDFLKREPRPEDGYLQKILDEEQRRKGPSSAG